MTLEEALQLGIQRHRSGQLAEAEEIYRKILAVQPSHSDALHLLGASALQRGSLNEARESITRAIAINPNAADYHVTLGVVLDTLKQLDEALAEFRRAAELGPDRAEVLTNFGNALRKSGQMKESVDVCRRALSLRPDYAPACVNLGLALRESSVKQPELLDEAIQWLQKATNRSPNDPQAHMHLAIALTQKRKLDEALESARRALAIQPDGAEAHNVMGSILRETGRLEEAVAESRRATVLRPDFHEAHLYLAMSLRDLGRLDEAIAAFQSAIALKPQNAEAHNALAFALCSKYRYVESEAACGAALTIRPNYDEAHNNLGLALQGQSRWEEAIAAHRAALSVRPGFPEAHNNISIAYAAIGDDQSALQSVETALKFRPDYSSAHWNRGLRLLTIGDYERGWPEYEWRRRIPEFKLLTDFPRPMWDGSDLSGKRILIHNEQGFGDAIQFFRYLPLVAQRGGKVMVWCQDSLVRLCQRVEGVEEVVAHLSPETNYEVHCPLMSLAHLFKTTVQTIPANVPYLSVDSKWADYWRSRIPTDSRQKVGFIWANKPNPANRCPTAAAWSPIGKVNDIWFCSLQKRDTSEEARTPPPSVEVTDWTDELHDFADTAALIENLDLLITVDTAVAHLAGAMGKPVWMLLKFRPDWRWLLDRSDSPWYPTMRLFRQPKLGDWDTPIREIVDALKAET